ncbi:SLC13 family permease [Comamonas serinivorans]|nr:SLC13 family permease [Comamonas serinivorans]
MKTGRPMEYIVRWPVIPGMTMFLRRPHAGPGSSPGTAHSGADQGVRRVAGARACPVSGTPAGCGARTAPAAAHALPTGRLALAAALGLASTAAILQLPGWPWPARLSLLAALACLIAWTVLRWADTPVAVAACLALVGLQVVSPLTLAATVVDPLLWLMAGAFVLSAALRLSGVAERLLRLGLGADGQRFDSLCGRLTLLIAATAFVIPSTSARAALLLPLCLGLMPHLSPAQARALALLCPTVILLSAGGVLTGAGAHLVTLDFVRTQGGPAWHWLDWLRLAGPFALGSCALATAVILRAVPPAERRQRVTVATPLAAPAAPTPWTHAQRPVAAIAALAVLGWATGATLGLQPAAVAVIAALAVLTGGTGLQPGRVLRQVEWRLLLFMAASQVLGEALLTSGAASALAAQALNGLALSQAAPGTLYALAAVVAVLAHGVVPSRTARAVVLLPTVVLPLAATGLNPALLAMLVVQGTGFCQTLSASAKPVAVFARVPGGFTPADLLRLASVLAPALVLWLLVHALWVWPALGLR